MGRTETADYLRSTIRAASRDSFGQAQHRVAAPLFKSPQCPTLGGGAAAQDYLLGYKGPADHSTDHPNVDRAESGLAPC